MLRKFFVHISLIFLGLIAVKAQESLNTLIFRGNRSFDKQKYGEAISTFSEAVKKNEKDFGAHYNLGNSLYKIKKYDEAIAEYQKAQKNTNNKDEKAIGWLKTEKGWYYFYKDGIMQKNARSTFEAHFHYQIYLNELSDFLINR